MRFRVHIMTTAGPVRIQSIGEEEPRVRSAICLDGRAVALPVSAAYDAFVRVPTGVVERFTGHPAYRMDVAAPVEDGRSWQLPVLIAHVAEMAGALVPVGAESADDRDVFATGEVDRDLKVLPVDHVRQKLQSIGEAGAAADRIVMVPGGQSADDATAVAVDTVEAALRALGLPAAATQQKARRQLPRPIAALLLASCVALAAAIFSAVADVGRWNALGGEGRALDLEQALADAEDGWDGSVAALYGRWLAWRKPDPDAARVSADAEYAPADGDCTEKTRRARRPVEVGKLPSAVMLCALTVNVHAAAGVAVTGRFAVWLEAEAARAARTLRGSAQPDGRTWRLEFDAPPKPGARFRLVALLGRAEVSGSQPWFRTLLSEVPGGPTWIAETDRLSRLGLSVLVAEWPVAE